jgi:hypothetical protein
VGDWCEVPLFRGLAEAPGGYVGRRLEGRQRNVRTRGVGRPWTVKSTQQPRAAITVSITLKSDKYVSTSTRRTMVEHGLAYVSLRIVPLFLLLPNFFLPKLTVKTWTFDLSSMTPHAPSFAASLPASFCGRGGLLTATEPHIDALCVSNVAPGSSKGFGDASSQPADPLYDEEAFEGAVAQTILASFRRSDSSTSV